jgi:hypothetical protein
MVEVGPDAPARQRQAIRLDLRLAAGRQCCDAQREREFDFVAGPKQHRYAARRA